MMFLLITILAFGSSYIIQSWLKSTYAKWQLQPNAVGATGAQVARHILDVNNLQKVRLEKTQGTLSDHYIPSQELIRLSELVHDQPSVASIAIAAHEVGHALQKADRYMPLKVKAIMMPVAAVASQGGILIFLAGTFIGSAFLSQFGTLAFVSGMGMQLLNLPIEFDASRRALAQLQKHGLVSATDVDGSKSVLRAAAMTYVASAATSVAFIAVTAFQLLGRRRE